MEQEKTAHIISFASATADKAGARQRHALPEDVKGELALLCADAVQLYGAIHWDFNQHHIHQHELSRLRHYAKPTTHTVVFSELITLLRNINNVYATQLHRQEKRKELCVSQPAISQSLWTSIASHMQPARKRLEHATLLLAEVEKLSQKHPQTGKLIHFSPIGHG